MKISDLQSMGTYRRIPLALLFTLIIQAASILIWATQLDARVNSIEHQCSGNNSLVERFARIEERINDMKQQLDRLTERLLK